MRRPRVTARTARWRGRPTEWERAWAARPRLRGWLHAGALPVALGATTALALRRRRHRNAVAVYGAGLCAMLATSAGYHRLTRTEAQYRWSRPADHVMIFAAIAGTATPVATGVLPPRAVRPAVTALWVAAAAGAFARVVDLRRGTFVGHVASVGLGWSGLALLPLVVRRHGVRVGALLAAGGVSYTVGAAFFAARRPNPWPEVFGYHEVWHTATLIGAAFHLAAIAEITRDDHDVAAATGPERDGAGPPAVVSAPAGTAGQVDAVDEDDGGVDGSAGARDGAGDPGVVTVAVAAGSPEDVPSA